MLGLIFFKATAGLHFLLYSVSKYINIGHCIILTCLIFCLSLTDFSFELLMKCREFSVCGGDDRSVWNDEILHKHTKAYIVSLLLISKSTFYFKLIICTSDWKKSCVMAT
jgi:hypothetical protein